MPHAHKRVAGPLNPAVKTTALATRAAGTAAAKAPPLRTARLAAFEPQRVLQMARYYSREAGYHSAKRQSKGSSRLRCVEGLTLKHGSKRNLPDARAQLHIKAAAARVFEHRRSCAKSPH